MKNVERYRRNPVLNYPERQWPNKEIEKAPIWCSVDLRDGNQALIDPMIVEEKIEFFEMLIKLGFKEIEIGFPAASQIEYDFLRQLVDRKLIPDDVWVQVLTQCREELIERTFESIQGIKNVIVHIYNSTSVLQRDVVFNMEKDEIIGIAVNGTRCLPLHSLLQLQALSSLTAKLPERVSNCPYSHVLTIQFLLSPSQSSVMHWSTETIFITGNDDILGIFFFFFG